MTRMPLGGGPPVGYREVVVWHGANGEFGKTMHTFRTVRDVDDDQTTSKWPFYKRTSREWMDLAMKPAMLC